MGLFTDIGRAYDWISEVTVETVEGLKVSAPDLRTLGEETLAHASSSGKALAEAAIEATADAASWIADALREGGPKNPSAKNPSSAAKEKSEDRPTSGLGSQDAAGYSADNSKTLVICVKSGCSNSRVSDEVMCYEHLYETRGYQLAALRAREKLQAIEDQRLATLCTWKSCDGKRVYGGIYCSFHQRETEQLKARRCGQKYRYPLLEDARAAALRMQKLDLDAFNVYMCNFCNHYHIGHAVAPGFNTGKTPHSARKVMTSDKS